MTKKVALFFYTYRKGWGKEGEDVSYIFYIDVWLWNNFTMDLLGLWLVGQLRKKGRKIWWLVAVAAAGSATAAVILVSIRNMQQYQWFVFLLIDPLMLFLAFKQKYLWEFIKDYATCLFVFALQGGIAYALMESSNFHFERSEVYLGIFLLLKAGSWCVQNLGTERQPVQDALLIVRGREIPLKVYWDSGNLLMDPFFGRPVQIMERKRMEEIIQKEQIRLRTIPFCTVGDSQGKMEVMTAEKLIVQGKGEQKVYRPVDIGLSTEAIFTGKEYEMLLNARMH